MKDMSNKKKLSENKLVVNKTVLGRALVKHWRTGTSSKNSINACQRVTSRDARVTLSSFFANPKMAMR
jgi:hypothetical protein